MTRRLGDTGKERRGPFDRLRTGEEGEKNLRHGDADNAEEGLNLLESTFIITAMLFYHGTEEKEVGLIGGRTVTRGRDKKYSYCHSGLSVSEDPESRKKRHLENHQMQAHAKRWTVIDDW